MGLSTEEAQNILSSLNINESPGIDDAPSKIDIEAALEQKKQVARWQRESMARLENYRAVIMSHQDKGTASPPDLQDYTNLIYTTSCLLRQRNDREDALITDEMAALSQDILGQVISFSPHEEILAVIRTILSTIIRPLFAPSGAHPHINPTTGRKLARPLGGPMSFVSELDEYPWKRVETGGWGCWNALRWCVDQLKTQDFESLWPQLVPPIMTMMDDSESVYRLRGIWIVSSMIQRVEAGWLQRTGIDELIRQSLAKSAVLATSTNGAELMKTAVDCSVQVINLTTSRRDSASQQRRYERLCNLLTETVFSGAWMYGGTDIDVMTASVEVADRLCRELGVGCVRFLKALIPQLTTNLMPKPMHLHTQPQEARLQAASCCCLLTLLEFGRPRILAWRFKITDGVLRCWVSMKDRSPEFIQDRRANARLQEELTKVFAALCFACPSIIETQVPTLLKKDRAMFERLVLSQGR